METLILVEPTDLSCVYSRNYGSFSKLCHSLYLLNNLIADKTSCVSRKPRDPNKELIVSIAITNVNKFAWLGIIYPITHTRICKTGLRHDIILVHMLEMTWGGDSTYSFGLIILMVKIFDFAVGGNWYGLSSLCTKFQTQWRMFLTQATIDSNFFPKKKYKADLHYEE